MLVYSDALPKESYDPETNSWTREEHNYFGFPADVSPQVRIAEYVAMFIAVFTQDDLVQALNLLNKGCYDRKAFRDTFQHANSCKWWMHTILRFVVGAIGLFVTFILIMKQDFVLGVLLNFTALQFVANLDNVAFKLFEMGFFGRHVQKETKKILNAKHIESGRGENTRSQRLFRGISLGILFAFSAAGVASIQHQQMTGVYLRLVYPNCTVAWNPNWSAPRSISRVWKLANRTSAPVRIGDGVCDWWSNGNTEVCGWDGGDCIIQEYPNCHVVYPYWIGDGICDSDNNYEDCGWDEVTALYRIPRVKQNIRNT